MWSACGRTLSCLGCPEPGFLAAGLTCPESDVGLTEVSKVFVPRDGISRGGSDTAAPTTFPGLEAACASTGTAGWSFTGGGRAAAGLFALLLPGTVGGGASMEL